MIDDILAGCFEGGSNYWIDEVEIKRLGDNGNYYGLASTQITRYGLILIHSDGESNSLYKRKFLKGCQQYANRYGKFEFENFDADDYDQILQYALFNEIVYG